MARHFSGIQAPDFPSYDTFLARLESVNDEEKEALLEKIRGFWIQLGKVSVGGKHVKL